MALSEKAEGSGLDPTRGSFRWAAIRSRRHLDRFVAGGVVLGIASGFLSNLLVAPANASGAEKGVYAVAAFVIAVLVAIVAAYAWAGIRAPYEQRDGLRAMLSVQGQVPEPSPEHIASLKSVLTEDEIIRGPSSTPIALLLDGLQQHTPSSMLWADVERYLQAEKDERATVNSTYDRLEASMNERGIPPRLGGTTVLYGRLAQLRDGYAHDDFYNEFGWWWVEAGDRLRIDDLLIASVANSGEAFQIAEAVYELWLELPRWPEIATTGALKTEIKGIGIRMQVEIAYLQILDPFPGDCEYCNPDKRKP